MTPFRDAFARFARETASTPEGVARVRQRLAAVERDEEICRVLLHQLPAVPPGAESRVRRRLEESLHRPARGRVHPAWAGGLLAAAAAAAVAVAVLRPDVPEATVAMALVSEATPSEVLPTSDVHLVFQGHGTVGGTEKRPRVLWETGTLEVDVTPHQGIDLTVETREAEVRVLGTAFTVTRDALGTAVEVHRGRVAVACAAGQAAELGPGEHQSCLPVTPAGLLARVLALRDQGASADLVLATTDLALGQNPETAALRGELLLQRIQALVELEREAEALDEIRRFLDSGTELRRPELHALAARLAQQTGGCEAAQPHLEALLQETTHPAAAVQLADCIRDVAPDRARALLEAALDGGLPSEQEAAVRLRLERLGSGGSAR